MKYAYFPGCSLKSSGRAYEESFLAICRALEIGMDELDDWNCCGATAYMSVDEANSHVLATRNLALAEKEGLDVVVPCAGCYGVLAKSKEYLQKYPSVRNVVTKGLQAGGLTYEGRAQVRHPLDILSHDLPPRALRSKVKRPLKGLKVACYYGCRLIRPVSPFDDMHDPQTMDGLLKSVGARLVEYGLKGKCCGGSLTGTVPEAGLPMCYDLLKEAHRQEADVIATACPLCQFNLECYQDDIAKKHPDLKPMPVVYFTQLLGVAMGLDAKELGLHRQIVPIEDLLKEKGILGGEDAKPKAKEPAAAGGRS